MASDPAPRCTAWTGQHVARIAAAPRPCAPLIPPGWGQRPLPGHDLWDFWPVQTADGAVAAIAGGALWMALAAPAAGDPDDRHVHARIRLFHVVGGQWRDLGPALPDGLAPGSREWSGSAIIDADGRHVRLFFTAAGQAGEARPTWAQRLFWSRARLDDGPRLAGWQPPRPIVASDGDLYHPADQRDGAPGTIKAFRDPGYFRDPRDGVHYILFTASLGRSGSAWNGAIGLARASTADPDDWQLAPPILSADGLNNELERPHMLALAGRYYLFWSTQRRVFAAGGPDGPTGLYGMVGDSVAGPFVPLNGSGLVIANPDAAPDQAYSWLVTPDLAATSFIDRQAAGAQRRFGGMRAPRLQLAIDGTTTQLIATEMTD
jgi:levansucrase